MSVVEMIVCDCCGREIDDERRSIGLRVSGFFSSGQDFTSGSASTIVKENERDDGAAFRCRKLNFHTGDCWESMGFAITASLGAGSSSDPLSAIPVLDAEPKRRAPRK